jgi:hypothetical protein
MLTLLRGVTMAHGENAGGPAGIGWVAERQDEAHSVLEGWSILES